jgi:rRNA-processing protein FCF1
MEAPGLARVVLMDTNGFGAGVLSGIDLSRIEQMVRDGVKVFVPDVVCRELAVHVEEAFDAIRFDLLSAAGFKELESLRKVNSEQVYEGIVSALEDAGCQVRISNPAWWMNGVLNQIASAPPAEIKKGVKTGAADAIVASHALNLSREFESVLVISNDNFLISHLETLGIPTARDFQNAAGRLLNNASPQKLAQLLNLVWGGPEWEGIFRSLVENVFQPAAVRDLNVLGFSNLVGDADQLYATTLFSFHESLNAVGAAGGINNGWSKGKQIYSVETRIDAHSFMPTSLRIVEELTAQFSYDDYPLPTAADTYVRIEQRCITDPTVNASFEISGTASQSTKVTSITVRLEGEIVAKVDLHEFEVERTQDGDIWFDQHSGGISISGGLTEVQAPGPITTAGFLGNRVMRLWAARQREVSRLASLV